MKKIFQTRDMEQYFQYDNKTMCWKHKNKEIIKDQKIVDILNQIWYNEYKGSRGEIFVNFREFEAIRKFIENNKINGGI